MCVRSRPGNALPSASLQCQHWETKWSVLSPRRMRFEGSAKRSYRSFGFEQPKHALTRTRLKHASPKRTPACERAWVLLHFKLDLPRRCCFQGCRVTILQFWRIMGRNRKAKAPSMTLLRRLLRVFNSYSARTLSPKAVFREMVALLRRYVRKHGYTMRMNIPYKLRSTGHLVGADTDSDSEA